MSVFGRRRRLTCFFCGQPQSIVSAEPVRKFTCTSPYCQSVNILDASGNIVDYVPSPQSNPAPAPRYGRPIRSPSPPNDISNVKKPGGATAGSSVPLQPIFCHTCQNHLTIKNNLLADYLPPEDDPEYEVYWAKLPEFKRSLEEKYPEPCPPCELKASQKIKQANYLAKAAMIGRLLEQSQNMKPSYSREPWGASRVMKLAFWVVRGFGWYGMHFLTIAWHGGSMLCPIPLHHQADVTGTWTTCVNKSLQDQRVDVSCYESVALSAKKLIPLSFVFSFWNYQALAQTRHPTAKLVGMHEFMRAEVMLFFVRMLGWWVLAPGRVKEDIKTSEFIIFNFGFFILAAVGYFHSITALKVVRPTSINLREPDQPNTPTPPTSSQYPPPRQPYIAPASPSPSPTMFPRPQKYEHHKTSSQNPFSSHSTPNTHLPHPKVKEEPDDKMDWDPSPQKNPLWAPVNSFYQPGTSSPFRSMSPSLPQQSQQANGKPFSSPFANPIPAAPRTSMFQKLIPQQNNPNNPNNPLRESFFRPNPDNVGLRKTHTNANNISTSHYPPMAEAKFYPKQMIDGADTGLEGLMTGALKLEDEPEVIRTARVAAGTQAAKSDMIEASVRIFLSLVSTCGFFYLGAREKYKYISPPLAAPLEWRLYLYAKLASLFVAGCCPVLRLGRKRAVTVKRRREGGSAGAGEWDFFLERALLAAEGMAGVMLVIWTAGETDLPRAELAGKLYLGWVLSRQIWAGLATYQEKGTLGSGKSGVEAEELDAERRRRRREISPGLGEWPRPLGSRNQINGKHHQAGGDTATLRREGSSGLPALRKEGSAGLQGMLPRMGGGEGVPSMRREGSAGLQRMASGGGGGLGVPSTRREISGGFSGMRLS